MADYKNKLSIKDWQQFFIDSDPHYGDVIARILQSIYKNKQNSLLSLVSSIEKNRSIVLSGEGAIEVLYKIRDLINLSPKFYIGKKTFNTKNDFINEENSKELFTVKCDFIITLNFNNIIIYKEAYINEIKKNIEEIEKSNNEILINYLIKEMSLGNYFVSQEFLEKEIFEAVMQYCSFSFYDIFKKFNIKEYSTFYSLLSSNNKRNNEFVGNIKVLAIPFTAFHADNYLSKTHQQIYRELYDIGKNELNTKLIYLNSDHFIENENKTVYDLLVQNVFYTYLPNEITDNKSGINFFEFEIDYNNKKESFLDDIMELENFNNDEGFFTDEDNISDTTDTSNVKFDNYKRKKMILNILKKDKISRHDWDMLDSADVEKLHVKKTFVEVINYLSNPFLSKIVNTNSMRFLKRYIITNYGKKLDENISEEKRILIEKKLIDYVQSNECYFIEYFSNVVKNVAELSNEKEVLVESVIKNSFLYKNFFLVKYIVRPKKINTKILKNFFRIIGNGYFSFLNDGVEEDRIIVPFIKIKEFLVYLISEEITPVWEKLSKYFDEIEKYITDGDYVGIMGDIQINMVNYGGLYNISVKEGKIIKDFQIKSIDDIEFIFQDKEQEKFKSIINAIYKLYQRLGFGFDSRKDYIKLIDIYISRCNEYFLFKSKADKYDKITSGENGFIAFLKKIFYWIPKSLNEHKLFKTMNKKSDVSGKIKYYYKKKENKNKLIGFDGELKHIKNKISNFISSKSKSDDYYEYVKNKNLEFEELGDNSQISDLPNYKTNKPIPLEEIKENDEKKLFEFIKNHLNNDNDVIYTRKSKLNEEKIVLYSKKGEISINLSSDINTDAEFVTRYFHIKNLKLKNYIVEKEVKIVNDNKKYFAIFFSKSYRHFNMK